MSFRFSLTPVVAILILGTAIFTSCKKEDKDDDDNTITPKDCWDTWYENPGDVSGFGVSDMALDNSGNLWIATSGGVGKFDGTSWTLFDEANSGLPSNRANSIAIDNSGTIWIGIRDSLDNTARLVKFDGSNTWTEYDTVIRNHINFPLDFNTITDIAVDANNTIWLATNETGLIEFDGSQVVANHVPTSGFPIKSVSVVTRDNNGVLWVGGTNKGLARLDGGTWTVYSATLGNFGSNDINAITFDADNNLWVGSRDNGVFRFDGNSDFKQWDEIFSNLPSDDVRGIAIDGEGNVFVGFDEVNFGIWKFTGEDFGWEDIEPALANWNGGEFRVRKMLTGTDNKMYIGASSGTALFKCSTDE